MPLLNSVIYDLISVVSLDEVAVKLANISLLTLDVILIEILHLLMNSSISLYISSWISGVSKGQLASK